MATTFIDQSQTEGLLSLLTQTLVKEARNVSVIEEIAKMEQRIIRHMEEYQEKLVQRMWKENPPVPPVLMTIRQAAAYIGRTEGAVRSMVEKGRLETDRLDGRIQIRRAYLDGLLDNHRVRGHDEL